MAGPGRGAPLNLVKADDMAPRDFCRRIFDGERERQLHSCVRSMHCLVVRCCLRRGRNRNGHTEEHCTSARLIVDLVIGQGVNIDPRPNIRDREPRAWCCVPVAMGKADHTGHEVGSHLG